MSTTERKDQGSTGRGQGGAAVTLARVLGEGDDPLGWSFPIGSAWGLALRVHVFFPIWAVWELILSIPKTKLGPVHVATALSVLFMLVVAREVGRWLIISRRAVEADQTVLWPLGATVSPQEPSAWVSPWPGVLGALVVNALLVPVLAGAVWLAGLSPDVLMFNPLDPGQTLASIGSWWGSALWWGYYLNFVLLGLNLLVPAMPFDAGRVAEAGLSGSLGRQRAAGAAAKIGMAASVLLFVIAMSGGEARLLGVSVIGLFASVMQYRRADFVRGSVPTASDRPLEPEPPPLVGLDEPADPAWPEAEMEEPAELPEVEAPSIDPDPAAEVDRILAKISNEGIASLTPEERVFLEEASNRMRKRD